jgi:hypothetical protein
VDTPRIWLVALLAVLVCTPDVERNVAGLGGSLTEEIPARGLLQPAPRVRGVAHAPAAAAPPAIAGPPAMRPSSAPTPDIAVIDDLARLYGPVVFDHTLHVEMCEITGDCGNCHHQTPADVPITGCRECHSITRAADELRRPSLKGAFHRQCLDCHREWSGANACGFCHVEVGATPSVCGPSEISEISEFVGERPLHKSPEPSYVYETERETLAVVTFHHADHVEVFGLACADCHRDDSCDSCHGAGSARRVVSREQDCATCHSESTCTTCHEPAQKRRFEHGVAAGWALGSGHEQLACAECHGSGTGATVGEPTSLRCRGCHEAAHGAGLDQRGAEVPLLGSHAFFECTSCHEGAGAGAVRCLDCHDERSYPAFLPGLATAGRAR